MGFCLSLVYEVIAHRPSIRNGACRVPVKKVEMMIDETWGEMRRTFNNMYAANGGPFNTWPLPLRITSMLNDTVLDM